MGIERLFNLLVGEFNNDKIALEDELEMVINSNKPIKEKTKEIKDILNSMAILEISLHKFTELINNNDKTKEITQDGKV